MSQHSGNILLSHRQNKASQKLLKELLTLNKKKYSVQSSLSDSNDKEKEYPQRIILDKIQKIVQGFQNESLSYIYSRQKTLEKLIDEYIAISSIPITSKKFINISQLFLDLMRFKMERFQGREKSKRKGLALALFPSLYRAQENIHRLTSYRGKSENISAQQTIVHQSDDIFYYYVQDLEAGKDRDKFYVVQDIENTNKLTTVSESVSKCSQFFNTDEIWKNMFLVAASYLNTIIPNNFHNKNPLPILKSQCFGCIQFFYAAKVIDIIQQWQHMIVLAGLSEDFLYNQDEVKDQICGLLNHQGGVLLFDCRIEYLHFVPYGEFMDLTKQKLFFQAFEKCLEQIHPIPSIGKDIFISFVPVVQDNFSFQSFFENRSQQDLKFKKDLYVARIIVKPKNKQQTYLWKQGKELIWSIRTQSVVPKGKKSLRKHQSEIDQLRGEIKLQKNKYRDPSFDSSKSSHDKNSFLDNICKPPLIDLKQQEQASSNSGTKQQYSCVSLMSKAIHQLFPLIIQNLKKYGIESKIETPFKGMEQIGAFQHCALIYHNIKYYKISQEIQTGKEFQFLQKKLQLLGDRIQYRGGYIPGKLQLLQLTDYLKLIDNGQGSIISEVTFERIRQNLQRNFADQVMQMWKCGFNTFYIKTKRKESLLYVLFFTQKDPDLYRQRIFFKMQNPESTIIKLVYPSKKL